MILVNDVKHGLFLRCSTMYLYIRLRCKRVLRLATAIDQIFVLVAEANGWSQVFRSHKDCLTVDEMEKHTVYDSGTDCREVICFYFYFFFFSCFFLLPYNYVAHIFFKSFYLYSPFFYFDTILLKIKNHIFADIRYLFFFFATSLHTHQQLFQLCPYLSSNRCVCGLTQNFESKRKAETVEDNLLPEFLFVYLFLC